MGMTSFLREPQVIIHWQWPPLVRLVVRAVREWYRTPQQSVPTPGSTGSTGQDGARVARAIQAAGGSLSRTSHDTEEELVRDLVDAMQSTGAFGSSLVGREFNRDGRTDVVCMASNGEVLAFEAKLSQWRVALHQAYRNTSYAHRSYVVLPLHVAERARSFSDEFARRRVGLCAVRADGTVAILHDAPKVDPPMPWVSDRAVAYLKARAE